MKCPSCSADLVRAAGFPGGLAGSLVRVDCPLPACARALVARVPANGDDALVLMSEDEGGRAALAVTGARRIPTFTVVGSLGVGGMLALALLPSGLSAAGLAVLAVVGAASGLAVAIGLRRWRAKRDAARLLEAIAHVPHALEPVVRGYRR